MTHTHDLPVPGACQGPHLTRRATLGGLGAALVLGHSSISFGAASAANRLVVINLRGGLDGLATVIPYGDPALAGLRAGLVPPGMRKIDHFYALHPALVNFSKLMSAGQASVIHAVGPTVATRSHFAAQDALQSGCGQSLTQGWLNRALGLLGTAASGLSLSAQIPLLLRGPTLMPGWAPDPFPQLPGTLATTLTNISATDPVLGPALSLAFSERANWGTVLNSATNASDIGTLATIAGSLLATQNGPRVAVLETDNFDSHASQNDVLNTGLPALDGAIANLQTTLGAAWNSTVVMTMTEFGRTAYQNGTNGTDHGTGFAVLLAGGAVNGGRVLGTWPGLGASQLYQGRDLAPTTDFRAIAMGLLISQLGLSPGTQQTIFPGSAGIAPLTGLTRS